MTGVEEIAVAGGEILSSTAAETMESAAGVAGGFAELEGVCSTEAVKVAKDGLSTIFPDAFEQIQNWVRMSIAHQVAGELSDDNEALSLLSRAAVYSCGALAESPQTLKEYAEKFDSMNVGDELKKSVENLSKCDGIDLIMAKAMAYSALKEIGKENEAVSVTTGVFNSLYRVFKAPRLAEMQAKSPEKLSEFGNAAALNREIAGLSGMKIADANPNISITVKNSFFDRTEQLLHDAQRASFDARREAEEALAATKGTNRIVLFYGGMHPGANYSYYYQDLCMQYAVAREYASPENIFILYADGLDPAKDQNLDPLSSVPELVNSDMSMFKESPILAATPENYEMIMRDIQKVSTPDDHLWVHSFDHGAEDGSICAWGGDIKPRDFARPIQGCPGRRTVTMHQCYAGKLAEAFDKSDPNLAVWASAGSTPTAGNYGPRSQLAALDYLTSLTVKAQDLFKTMKGKHSVYKYQYGLVETPQYFGGNFRILATPQSQIGVKPLPIDYGMTISVYA